MTFAQRLFEWRMQRREDWVGTIFEVLGNQIFVFLDDLVDQRAVGAATDAKSASPASCSSTSTTSAAPMSRKVEQHAPPAEALADVGHQSADRDCRHRSC